ncbi:M48 family metalloprotease [Pseudidiomarina sp.]|uniref:beta-barrel assembly-enhancing protease n=1 Tax=Pseudidiomarina sp. TaxID=2081707 RepID=UPI00299E3506|nr:M48 family metalloprotease [Pseudidiomarina sp.]MDX1705707.1 M48 family metalloprotease [Pseudidiomarina sp.]
MQFPRISVMLAATVLSFMFANASAQSRLPEIGTTGASVMSIEKEQTFGDLYMRQVRATAPIAGDPVLNEYLKDLGNRLVREADDVRFPFTFFWVNQDQINAFAFFGGYIGINTGLIAETQTESELASVVAHEVAHVSQRHLVRNMGSMQNAGPATIAAVVGSLLLSMVSPDLGMAAMSGALAGVQQASINYTRMYEQEADRIGLNMMARAGFDPQGAPDFFGRMAEKYRYASKVPAMLQTHPVSEARIADTRQRAEQMPRPLVRDQSRYWLAKYRVQTRHLKQLNKAALTNAMANANNNIAQAARYGLAILQLDQGQPEQALTTLQPLLQRDPMNAFYLDVQTDILLALKRYEDALKMLEKAYIREPNEQTITLNFANAALEAGQYDLATRLLRDYLTRDDDNVLAIDLLIDAYRRKGDPSSMFEYQSRLYALYGDFDEAINSLHRAHKQSSSELEQRRLQARVEQLMEQKRQLEALR